MKTSPWPRRKGAEEVPEKEAVGAPEHRPVAKRMLMRVSLLVTPMCTASTL